MAEPESLQSPGISAAAYEMLMHRLDHVVTRMEGLAVRLESVVTTLEVHTVQIKQSDERRERDKRDTRQTVGYLEKRIEVLEEFAAAHSNGKAEAG